MLASKVMKKEGAGKNTSVIAKPLTLVAYGMKEAFEERKGSTNHGEVFGQPGENG